MLADFPRPVPGAAAKTAGIGLLRYWPKQGGSTVVTGLSKAEVADLTANGVEFATIYEAGSASWMSGGYAAGVAAANWLKTQFAAAGYTPPCVYLAADSNTLAAVSVNACLDGAASVLGRDMVGLYAFLPQLQSAHAGGHASRYWLTGRYVAPSAYPWINVYQCQGSQPAQYPTTVSVAGQTGDGDIAFASDWGQSGVSDMSFDLTTPVPVPLLDDNGNYVGDQKDSNGNVVTAPFQDFVRFGDAYANQGAAQVRAVAVQLAALQGALSDEQAQILAAVQGVQTGQVDVTSLANQLIAAIVAPLSAATAKQTLADLGAQLVAASQQ